MWPVRCAVLQCPGARVAEYPGIHHRWTLHGWCLSGRPAVGGFWRYSWSLNHHFSWWNHVETMGKPRHFWWVNPNKSSDIMTFALGCFSCFRWDGHMGISKWPIRRCSNASVRLCRTTLWPWRRHGMALAWHDFNTLRGKPMKNLQINIVYYSDIHWYTDILHAQEKKTIFNNSS